ncbi:MAG: hypothetical protein ISS31_00990 [Kiritimatiellae bacterium]|nr:hypothetical protein [Kiritimatiellia bacterium]
MLKKLAMKLKMMAEGQGSFDPSTIGDPLALHTEWTPARSGGASFRTHKLAPVSTNRLEFRASAGAKLFYLLFLLIGVGVLVGFTFAVVAGKGPGLGPGLIVPFLVGTVFACLGGGMLYFGTAPIVFDARKGYFWKGKKAPDEVFSKSSIKHLAKLEEIHALQLISEYCRSDKSSYYSYELNLVLKDGTRINVVDHGNQAKLREDAATLSEFLDTPIWDAI